MSLSLRLPTVVLVAVSLVASTTFAAAEPRTSIRQSMMFRFVTNPMKRTQPL